MQQTVEGSRSPISTPFISARRGAISAAIFLTFLAHPPPPLPTSYYDLWLLSVWCIDLPHCPIKSGKKHPSKGSALKCKKVPQWSYEERPSFVLQRTSSKSSLISLLGRHLYLPHTIFWHVIHAFSFFLLLPIVYSPFLSSAASQFGNFLLCCPMFWASSANTLTFQLGVKKRIKYYCIIDIKDSLKCLRFITILQTNCWPDFDDVSFILIQIKAALHKWRKFISISVM